MKKILFLLLAVTSPAMAGIGINTGNQKFVHTDPINGEEYQAVKVVDGTTGGTSSMTVTSGGAILVQQVGAYAVTVGSGTMNVISTSTASNFGATFPIQGTGVGFNSVNNGLQSGRVDISSNIIVVPLAVVSSVTLPSTLTQGTTQAQMIDSLGRPVVADIPWEIQKTTYNFNIAPDTVEHVFISSAAAGLRTRMCGCIFMNNSATNTGFTIYVTTSNSVLEGFTAAYPIGTPANYLPAGVRSDCGHPFLVGAIGGQMTIKASAAAVAGVTAECSYLQY